MYTILENARIVIALLKEHNIRHIVISPGGSNIPIVQGVQQDSFFTCYSVVDERSAMYFAIGLYLKLGVPIATSCTSAQATRNYIPGLTEAFYKHVPILAITMSKHPRYLYQEYMQSPIQTSLPEDSIKKSFSLPYITNLNDRSQCVRIANDAILELTHHGSGPIQLNIEVLDSETWQFDVHQELEPTRVIRRFTLSDTWSLNLENKKILLIIGEHRVFNEVEIEAIEKFCESNNVFVYVDHISNYHGKFARIAYLSILNLSQRMFDDKYAPDILITIGGITGDYGLYGKLFNSKADFEHWRISETGDVADTYVKLTKIFECSDSQFFANCIDARNSCHSYYSLWAELVDNVKTDIKIPFSNLYTAQQLHSKIPANSIMNFAILNSLRVWSNFEIDKSIECYSNVAAFGIDGCLSVLLGESVVSDELCFLITGDLAFYYDMNAVGIRHIKNNVRILLINNNGGAEFKLGNLQTKTNVPNYISADGHFKNAKGWAETNNFRYLSATSENDFLQQIDSFISQSSQSMIFEVFTTSENEKLAIDSLNAVNLTVYTSEAVKTRIKECVRKVVGEKLISSFKSLRK